MATNNIFDLELNDTRTFCRDARSQDIGCLKTGMLVYYKNEPWEISTGLYNGTIVIARWRHGIGTDIKQLQQWQFIQDVKIPIN